ncbi:protein phosphatase 2C domain-containing protein [Streptomyces sp. NPDC018036]|uniref:PP2C family serine/threonine-protein phosphatase n=1 Tax=Streptomyces sp. NPDC018036 TaxID=3365035 RepID=UPI0037B6C327
MNTPGPSRTNPHRPGPHQPAPHQTGSHHPGPQQPAPHHPTPRRPDPYETEEREPDVRRAEPGQADAGHPAGCRHDLGGTEPSWPDAREPDPLDATWQSVDQFFNDQPEPVPLAPADQPTAPTTAGPNPPLSYGPLAQPSPPPPTSYEPAPAPPFPQPGVAQRPEPRPEQRPLPQPSPHGPVPVPDAPAPRIGTLPVLGAPRHSGPKPPLYAPEPRELPSVREDPTAALTPDMVVDGAGYGALTVRAASVRGDSHRYQGEPRQDSLAVVRLGTDGPDGLLLLAVADGVGSAARSHIGSQEACRLAAMELDGVAGELCETLRSGDRTGFAALVDTAVGRVATLLAHRARERGDDPAAYATTLRALLVPLDPRVRTRGFLAVGDGGTALLRAGEWNLSLTDPEHDGDGMIDTRTAALPHGHRARALLLGPALPGDVLVLCTDGLSTPLAGEAGMRDFLASGWGQGAAPAPADFLWQVQYRVKSYDDDRTVVVLWEAVP